VTSENHLLIHARKSGESQDRIIHRQANVLFFFLTLVVAIELARVSYGRVFLVHRIICLTSVAVRWLFNAYHMLQCLHQKWYRYHCTCFKERLFLHYFSFLYLLTVFWSMWWHSFTQQQGCVIILQFCSLCFFLLGCCLLLLVWKERKNTKVDNSVALHVYAGSIREIKHHYLLLSIKNFAKESIF